MLHQSATAKTSGLVLVQIAIAGIGVNELKWWTKLVVMRTTKMDNAVDSIRISGFYRQPLYIFPSSILVGEEPTRALDLKRQTI